MKKIFYVVIALIFLSGCALSTIRPPKKPVRKPEPVERPVVERIKEVFTPAPKPQPKVVEEKEEILPEEPEKEEIK